MSRPVVHVDEKVSLLFGIPLSIQHFLAMFGASIWVASMIGLNPGIVLLMNGIGTLGYLLICQGKVPAFLGPSYSFAAPVLLVLGTDKSLWASSYPFALGGFVVVGLVIVLTSYVIKLFGSTWLKAVLPPALIGPVVTLIGFALIMPAANMAGLVASHSGYNSTTLIISMITFLTAVLGSILFRGVAAALTVLIAIVVGYSSALIAGIIDFSKVMSASVIALPHFVTPHFNLDAIMIILPAALVVISEHIGHFMVTQNIVQKDLVKDPGLHRSLLANGLASMVCGLFGSIPQTTYGENISVLAISRVYSVWALAGAALLSIVIAFSGTIIALIETIPAAVIGGIGLFLFGAIAVIGIRYLVDARVDYNKNSNLALSLIVFVLGMSGASINIGAVQLTGVALATLVGLLLSIIFYYLEKSKLTNEN